MRYEFPMALAVGAERIWLKCHKLFTQIRSTWLCWLWGVVHSGHVSLQGRTYLRTHKRGDIVLGRNVVFNSYFRTNLVGLLNPTVLDTLKGGRIEIGDESGASSVVISSKKLIRIGKRCKIGGNVRIFDHDFHSTDATIRASQDDRNNIRSKVVEIGDDCFIGTNAIILKGTKLGSRSIVAAGSIVFGLDVPPDSLVRGNPAEIIERRNNR